ncbi:hypothetical protein LSH36_550g03074 [Paralvinella palmiformis]|uniref:Uncharacterized protein n=1 Tax=Paralvinella palmiformis TaxID=53620 RepID=A0AAD9J6E8_9ANNE|nr:hypothetical protein LSH36_550g03074 [Paralvinella palmiformis]
MLQKHFPQPEGDMAASVVLFAVLFTPIPLFVVFVVLVIKRRCCDIVTEDRNVAVHFVRVVKDNVEIFIKSDDVSSKKDISTDTDSPITLEEMV